MEYFGIFALLLIAIGFSSFGPKIMRLERRIKTLEGDTTDIANLRNSCSTNMGKLVDIHTFDSFIYSNVKLLDIDDEWILIHEIKGKKENSYLIKIENIKSITSKELKNTSL